jgi:hypothetical protein
MLFVPFAPVKPKPVNFILFFIVGFLTNDQRPMTKQEAGYDNAKLHRTQ